MGTQPGQYLATALFCLVSAASAAPPVLSPFERQEQLKREPVDSIRLAFQREDPRLYWTSVYEKLPIDADAAIMLVEAAPLTDARRTGYLNPDRTQSRFGLFAVSGPGNRVQATLDIFRPLIDYPLPVMESPSRGRVYIHWLGDYGLYYWTTRYLYDLSSNRRARKTDYGRLALDFVTADGPRLYYRASYTDHSPASLHGQSPVKSQSAGLIFDTLTREFTITATPPAPLPRRTLPDWAARRRARLNPQSLEGEPVRLRRDLYAQVTTTGLHLLTPGGPPSFYPNPVITRQQLGEARPEVAQQTRPPNLAAFTPKAGFGPLALRGGNLWFLNNFYDGEGLTGVGFIGRLTPGQPTLDLRYLPEIACCSGSALHVAPEGEEVLYAALAARPEGAVIGRGLLRYHPATGETHHFPIPDLISSIQPAGPALALATDHGLYLLENDSLAHYRLEPSLDGGLEIVTLALPPVNSK